VTLWAHSSIVDLRIAVVIDPVTHFGTNHVIAMAEMTCRGPGRDLDDLKIRRILW
jgi:hypothetical protein